MESPPPPAAAAASAADTGSSIHIFFFPFAARGHTIPLLETTRLFAQRPGVRCSFVTTPGNSSYILPTIDEAKASGLPLDLLLLPFPSAEVGLPAGIESIDALPHNDADSQQKFGRAKFLLSHSFKDLVAEHHPDCVISDCIEVSLPVPCFVFSIIPPFAKSVAENVYMMTSRTGAAADTGDQAESNEVGPLALMGLPEFHETVGDRGLILTEWAPQVAILNHTATGGFLTHCGWNSTIEAVCAGLPLIAWPLHSEQFFNERHVVEVLGIGMRILDGAEMRSVDAKGKGVVKGEVIRDAVDRLMGGGEEEVRTMRVKANKYQELARSAMEEGGSSYVNLSSVIELIKEKKKEKRNIDVETGI